MTELPERWKFLAAEPAPRMLKEALKLYGTLEEPGSANNPEILAWADEIGSDVAWYDRDSIPWCGLFIAIVAKRAGKTIPALSLRARSWGSFGRKAAQPELGNVMVFWRNSIDSPSGHVGLYVGETKKYYYILGGNQSDSVCITRISKHRFLGSFAQWKIRKPANVRPIFIGWDGGQISENEI